MSMAIAYPTVKQASPDAPQDKMVLDKEIESLVTPKATKAKVPNPAKGKIKEAMLRFAHDRAILRD